MITNSRHLVLLTALVIGTSALAQSTGGDFTMTRSVIGTGGGSSSGGEFSVTGTMGQAGTAASQGGGFSVSGGFWSPGQRPDALFQNGFEE